MRHPRWRRHLSKQGRSCELRSSVEFRSHLPQQISPPFNAKTRQEKAGKPHFTSPHSKIGLGFVLLVLTTYASAFYNVATNGPVMVRGMMLGPSSSILVRWVRCLAELLKSKLTSPFTHTAPQPNFNWNSKIHKNLGKVCLVGSGE